MSTSHNENFLCKWDYQKWLPLHFARELLNKSVFTDLGKNNFFL